MRPRPLLSAIAVFILLSVAACGGGPHSSDEVYYLVTANKKVGYWQTAKAGFNKALDTLKVRGDFAGPDTYDPKEQVNEFRRIVGTQPAGILVSAADPNLMKPEIDAAVAKGIPVITIDADVPGSKRVLFIGTDNRAAGVMGGELLVKLLNGKGNVVVFTMPGQANLDERLEGYRSVLARTPGVKITEVIDIKGTPSVAFDRAEDILADEADKVQAFVCLEALAGKEVADVLSRSKATGKVIIAMDTDEGTLEWIRKGVIAATIAQKPFTMAHFGVMTLDSLHHNKIDLNAAHASDTQALVPDVVNTGATLVTKDNVEKFIEQTRSATGR